MSAAKVPPDDTLTDSEIELALEIARGLVRAGVPVFLARADPTVNSGYLPPSKWETSIPLLEVVDRWRPGMALCAVGGHVCDFLDVDPRNGGDVDEAGLRSAGMWPTSYGRAATPSGGTHDIIAPLRVGKGKVTNGIDLQGGLPAPDSRGDTHRGFVFIAPTVRVSQVDRMPRAYRWLIEPDMDLLAEEIDSDDSGLAIGTKSAEEKSTKAAAAGESTPTPADPVGLLRQMVTTFEALTEEGNNRTQELDNLALLAGHGVPTYWTTEQARARLLESALSNGFIRTHGQRAALIQINSGLADGAREPWAPLDPSEKAELIEVAHEVRRLRIRDRAARQFRTEQESAPADGIDRLVDGGTFIYDAPDHVPAAWGKGDEVFWSMGEPLLITGPTGTGKTTLGGQVVAARMGLIRDVLGYPVTPGRRVLYLAMDRPNQISRALARLLRQFPRDALAEKITFWRGPPPRDLAEHPGVLLEMAQRADADTVVLDSLKDAAVNLSDETVGQGISRAMQLCIAADVEVMGYHHQTKRGNGGISKPNSLADVYGSNWITAGVGSVLLIWGEAGDPIVELSHLKQPAGEVGPLTLAHDMTAGTMTVVEGGDVLDLLLSVPRTAAEIAVALYGASSPNKAQVEKARRKLSKLVSVGLAVQLGDPSSGGTTTGRKGGGEGARYGAVTRAGSVHDRSTKTPYRSTVSEFPQVNRSTVQNGHDRSTGSVHDRSTSVHEKDITAGESVHASVHARNEPDRSTPAASPLGGEAGDQRGDHETGPPTDDLDPHGVGWLRAHLTTAPQTIARLATTISATTPTIETALALLESTGHAQCHTRPGLPDVWSLPEKG